MNKIYFAIIISFFISNVFAQNPDVNNALKIPDQLVAAMKAKNADTISLVQGSSSTIDGKTEEKEWNEKQ